MLESNLLKFGKKYLITPTFVRIQFNFEFLFKTIFNFFFSSVDKVAKVPLVPQKNRWQKRWPLYNLLSCFFVCSRPFSGFVTGSIYLVNRFCIVEGSMRLWMKFTIHWLPGKLNERFWTLHSKTGRFLWRAPCLFNVEDFCKNIAQHSIDTSINQHQNLQGRLYQLSGETVKLFNWGKCLKFLTIL